jgi:hypothetical protein
MVSFRCNFGLSETRRPFMLRNNASKSVENAPEGRFWHGKFGPELAPNRLLIGSTKGLFFAILWITKR